MKVNKIILRDSADSSFDDLITFDNCKFNNKVGTIIWLHDWNYYPNKDYSVVEVKTQATIEYENGVKLEVSDLYRKSSSLVCDIIKVEDYEE